MCKSILKVNPVLFLLAYIPGEVGDATRRRGLMLNWLYGW